MAAFLNLEDSPMFRKQMHSLERSTDELKNRCQTLLKGCKKFNGAVGKAYDADMDFADCVEVFGSGHDPISVSLGGPILLKFTAAIRELGAYKELLRSQVEHMLIDRLAQFINVDINDVKESRCRFDQASVAYDQAREKLMSLKKGTKAEVVAELEENLNNSKSAFEKCRFNLVSALTSIETKKKFEFLESFSATMDAHLRYFKQGYQMLSQMEPFIHQVLTYSQQSKEMATIEQDKLDKCIQEFRTQAQLDSLHSPTNMEASSNGDGIHVVGVGPNKSVEALMQSTANGKVQIIKQGYLLKRSLNTRGDWKRMFFVLDSHGTLYYYREKSRRTGSYQSLVSLENGVSMFGRFRFSQNKPESECNGDLGYRTIDLRTSAIKIDGEQTDLLFCFRIICPLKTYTLQAENGTEKVDWVNKITGVIAVLLNSPDLQQLDTDSCCSAVAVSDRVSLDSHTCSVSSEDDMKVKRQNSVISVLRRVPGNDVCAECNAAGPDWASLNLGILMCIECSGVHRNLGVHISKVRSLTLDVKVWEPTILDLFRALGNAYCNSVWEQSLQLQDDRKDESAEISFPAKKPGPKDAFSSKEKYIQMKYVEKLLIVKETVEPLPSPAAVIWEAVNSGNIQQAYRLLVALDANPNITYDQIHGNDPCHIKADTHGCSTEKKHNDPALCLKIKSSEPTNCLQGCSLLHLACHISDLVMLELLLQFGADINTRDFHGRTPLHHCILKHNNELAKYLLRKGARPSIKDGGGMTAMERTMEMGAITDEELFILLAGS